MVVWTCNHCPYALAWHDRIVDAARDYAERGVRFFAVNSNDAERYPHDSLDAMRERVAAEEWPFPYLHDESQDAAVAWNAQVTPHLYVLDADQVVRYEGAPDADHQRPELEARLAARGARCRARRHGAASEHRPGRLLDQVEAVTGP